MVILCHLDLEAVFVGDIAHVQLTDLLDFIKSIGVYNKLQPRSFKTARLYTAWGFLTLPSKVVWIGRGSYLDMKRESTTAMRRRTNLEVKVICFNNGAKL